VAIEAGISDETLEQLVAKCHAENPHDPLLAEFRVLQACQAVRDGQLGIGRALGQQPQKLSLPWKIIPAVLFVTLCVLVAIPHFVRPRTGPHGWCLPNLKCIEGAKMQWAAEFGTNAHALTPRPAAIALYLKDRAMPQCPMGGTYNLGKTIGDKPTCSIPGHTL